MPFLGVPLLQATRLLITWFASAKHRPIVSPWASHRVGQGFSIVNKPLRKAKKYSSKPRTWDGKEQVSIYGIRLGETEREETSESVTKLHHERLPSYKRKYFKLAAPSCFNYQNISDINKSDLWFQTEKCMEKVLSIFFFSCKQNNFPT